MVFAPFLSRRSSTSVGTEQCVTDKVKEVRQIVGRKGSPLSAKQEEFCDEACIVRFLKAKGNHVKKAAKQVRATLTWRAMLDIDSLTADEFPAELASGTAFVAGRDEEGRPVLVVRLKPDDISNIDAQKRFLLYLAFTMEVSIACMTTTVNQCVLILDASFLKRSSSPSTGLSVVVQLFKLLNEHYPERLAMAFAVDAPPMLHLFWKGIARFLDMKLKGKVRFISSRSYDIDVAVDVSGNPNCRDASSAAAAENLLKTLTTQKVRSFSNREELTNWAALTDTQQIRRHTEDRELIGEEEKEGRTSVSKIISFHNYNSNPEFRQTTASSFIRNYPHVTRKSCSTHGSAMSDNTWISTATPSPIYAGSAAMAAGALSASANSRISTKFCEPRSLSFTSCRKQSEFVNACDNYQSFRRESSVFVNNINTNVISGSRRWLDFLSLGHNRSVSDADSVNLQQVISGNHHQVQQQDSFRPCYQTFLVRPYSEATFRSLMKPPLAGLISIISSDSCRAHMGMEAAKCKAYNYNRS